MLRRALLLAVALAAGSASASLVTQTITITNGWNAVYVSVGPEEPADEVFAEWPVWSVSAYNASAFLRTASTTGGATGESVVRAPYWLWSREAPHASTLKTLVADTVLVCFSTSAVPYQAVLRGVPAAPRLAWHASNESTDTLNPVGVRLSGSVKARDWFAGCGALRDPTFYVISGPDDAAPRFRPVASGTKTAYLNDGDVVFVPGREVSDWSGPLYIMPRAGLEFGEDGMTDEMTVRNDGAAEKTVRVSYVDSADGAARPELLFRELSGADAAAEWLPLTNALSRILATGETWRVVFALDRSKLAGTEAMVGGVLRIEELDGTRSLVWLPVSAKDVKPSAVWPQGLWRAELSLSRVSYYTADSNRVDGVAAGGRMKLTVYVHVDADGTARLLQRVTVAGVNGADGGTTKTLYGPDAALPSGLGYATRLSSAALPVDMPVTAAKSGQFGVAGAPLVFTYTIGANSPSNPFRHALHPLFDNKQMDFKTAAPDGDDISNYVGSVKPELFSIGGEVQFAFAENAATAWVPEEKLSGECKWIYTGVRRDGPVVADGTFTIQRIAEAPEINL
jgi:hypothetical protein